MAVTPREDHTDMRMSVRGRALIDAMCELERVLRSFGPDRRIATLIATQALLDGLDGDQAET
jgi:hypothetical protein